MKRIAPGAYDALLEALAVVYWKKSDLERFLRSQLKGSPELLAGLNFDDPKRRTAEALVGALSQEEDKYQATSIALLEQLAAFDDFPHLRRWDDADQLIENATAAVAEARKWVVEHSEITARRRAAEEQAAERREQDAARHSMSAKLAELKQLYLDWSSDPRDPQSRGRALEGLLNSLFRLWDLTPRGPFVLANEQIDGAFTFDTDDYILEARWRTDPTSRSDLDVFSSKLDRKARNTRGLFISVNGFAQTAIDAHRGVGTGLILMDGTDLFLVLDERIDMTHLLERKRRHASETGDPMVGASEILRGP